MIGLQPSLELKMSRFTIDCGCGWSEGEVFAVVVADVVVVVVVSVVAAVAGRAVERRQQSLFCLFFFS